MKSKLYQISQENIETILKYYNSTNSKIKNYYNYILTYIDYTKEYCSKIKELFNNNHIFNINDSSLDDYETIEINYDINNEINNNKNNTKSQIFEKRIKVTPILYTIETINIFF